MLDIDLNFLESLLNPCYAYFKDDIKIIQDAYLSNTPLDEKSIKKDNFNNTIYLFYNKIDRLINFINFISNELIGDFLYKFLTYFNTCFSEEQFQYFREKYFNEENGFEFIVDEDLLIFKEKFRNYLLNEINDKDNVYLDILNYLDECLEKYDKIMELLNSKQILIDNYNKKVKEAKYNLINFIKKFFNSDDEFEFWFSISENELFDFGNIKVFVNNDDNSIELRKKIFLDRNIDFNKLGINIYNSDECLKKLGYKYKRHSETYEGIEIFDILKEEIENFNSIYQNELFDIKLNFYKNDLIKQIRKEVVKKLNIENENEVEQLVDYFCEVLISYIIKNKNCEGLVTSLAFKNLSISIFMCQTLTINDKVFESNDDLFTDSFLNYYYTFGHELGHVYDGHTFKLIVNENKIFSTLFETYVDYRSVKIINDLIVSRKIGNEQNMHVAFKNNYSNYFILLDRLFIKYDKYFKKCLKNDSIEPLIELMGEANLNELISKLENFDIDKAKNNNEYAINYFNYIDNLLEVIEYKQKKRSK